MPFIETRTNRAITPEKRASMTRRMGKAIELLPGKSERWLMLGFREEPMAFQGYDAPCAMLEVQLYGTPDPAACDALSAELTAMVAEELEVPRDRVYVAYHSTGLWGWNGSDF